jgi:hypothetical protein
MLYELRTYIASPGCMDKLQHRFAKHTLGLFARHGIEAVGFWTVPEKPNRLVYLLRFRDKGHFDDAWASFRADADWAKVKAESERDGVLVADIDSQVMHATEYSPQLK